MALSGGKLLKCFRNIKLSPSLAFMSTEGSGSSVESPKHRNNELICSEFRNRNPRNLELMRIAYKPHGYHLDKRGREFWNKLVVKTSQHSVKAEIVHVSGRIVVTASSAEWGIKKQLYRYTDSCAHKAVGAALAHRTLECGITNVYCNIKAEEGTRMDFLLKAITANGLSLQEKPRFLTPDPFRKVQQDPSWADLKLV